MPNSGGFFAGADSPCCPDARGRTRGAAPSALPRGEGAPPLRPRGTFPSRGKSPKARQGGSPGPPRGTERKVKHFSLPLPLRFPHPLDRVSATKIDRFATLGWWANRSLFLLKLHRGHTLNCQSVARQVGFLEDAAGLFTLNQYRQDRGPGDQRGLRPLRRGSRLLRILEPGGPWRIFRSIYAASFLYARK